MSEPTLTMSVELRERVGWRYRAMAVAAPALRPLPWPWKARVIAWALRRVRATVRVGDSGKWHTFPLFESVDVAADGQITAVPMRVGRDATSGEAA